MVIPDEVRQQLKERFEVALSGPVHLTLYTKPGSSRLILPEGFGCPTCEDAREMAELLRDAAPEKVTLEQVDVTRDPERASADGIDDVPTIALASPDPLLPNPPHKGEGADPDIRHLAAAGLCDRKPTVPSSPSPLRGGSDEPSCKGPVDLCGEERP